ncbi:MAG: glycosyltransferase, partial [Alphaproteobacteria bacterium]|nr:glycosyltransferase [Alphaproteobacteria bacterium]
HYLVFGAREGRDPGPLFASAWYAARYLDGDCANTNPLLHYLKTGAATGCDPHPLFASAWYLQRNPDVAAAGFNPLVHYLLHGGSERRDPHPLFDAGWYVRRNADVAASGLNPLAHFLTLGAGEGRDPHPLFNTAWYLQRYPDVAAARVNALIHYLGWGAREGRDPHPDFSTSWYLQRNPDVAASGDNPLMHYALKGRAEGRAPRPPAPEAGNVLAAADMPDAPALAAAGVSPTGGRREGVAATYGQLVFDEWRNLTLDLPEVLRHIDIMLYRPDFVVVVDGAEGASRDRTVASLRRQVYPRWHLVEPTADAMAPPAALSDANAFLVWLDAGDVLHERALYAFACALNRDPTADLVYADEDCLEADGIRRRPFYKPDWSPDTLEGFNYIGSAACFRGRLAAACWHPPVHLYDLSLRVTECAGSVQHVRAVLWHRRRSAVDAPGELQINADLAALRGRLQRSGRAGTVTPRRDGRACYDVRIALPSVPLVSVVIPTAGKIVDLDDGRRVDLLTNCLDTIADRSSYRNLEFIIVDNGDLGGRRMAALHHRGCRMITYREPRFNVARKLNLGASIARADMLLLLNDDIEPLAADWIERLLEHFEKPHVGVVGAKLLYADGRIQHAGVVTNHGNPDHVRRNHPRDDPGYFFSTCAARNYAAVTGACMMTRTAVYRAVGGYTEDLAVSFNDVDYCLKVREQGLTVVYAPKAELTHFESRSRTPSLDMAEYDYFQSRWAHRIISDPFYNEDRLTLAPPTFEPCHA